MNRSSWNFVTGHAFRSHRKHPRVARRGGPVRLEQLEPRVVLASDLMLAEVMSSNDRTIDDEDGVPSDWFEIYNAGNTAASLAGLHVTDDIADRTKWTFPEMSLAPGHSIVVFASNKDRRDPNSELHTNFRLSDGDYLGLYDADGRTVIDAYESLPADYLDVSHGVSQLLQARELVLPNSVAKTYFPTAAADVPTASWTAANFDAAGWADATLGLGYDADATDGDFNPLIATNTAASMRGKTASAYVRSEFVLPETLPTFKNLDMTVNYDDGFVAYLNGQEVARVNAPETLHGGSTATGQHGGIEANLAYPSFASADDRDDFTLKGNAAWNGNRLTLTSPVVNQTSAVWTTNPVKFGPDYTFSASVVYDIHTPGGTFADSDGLGGEGVTFVLQTNDNNVLGLGGGGLGLDNTGSTFLAIELDSVTKGSFDPDETLPSHLGVDTSADGNVARVSVPRFNGNAFFAGQPGPGVNLIYLWVDYVGSAQELKVYMASNATKPATPTLTTTVDLTSLFAGDPDVFMGWTSATSDTYNGHDVLGWSVLTGVGELGREAESYDLSAHVDLLQPGKNVLAIHALNVSADDEDLLLVPQLTVQEVVLGELGYLATPSPGELNGPSSLAPSGIVTFSRSSAIYADPFDLELIPPVAGAAIYYSLDGTVPTEASTLYTGPLRIEGAVRVRARAIETGRSLGPVNTAGFSQLDDALETFESGQNFSSNLPIIVFETFGKDPHRQTVRKLETSVAYFIDPGVDGVATLLDTPEYTGRAGIRTRGQSSEGWLKKQYAVELWEEGNDDSVAIASNAARDKNVSIFGLPADSDWVLNGPYSDKTQLNNYLTFNWYREIGLYAPRVRLVEVFVNRNASKLDFAEDYRGTYVLMEKIKIDQNRVDIAQLEPGDNTEPDITGGYIWKKDKAGAGDVPVFTSKRQEIRIVEPQDPPPRATEIQPGEVSKEQKTWLLNHINEFEDALYGPNFADPKDGYAKYIDVDSWVDTWLMVEMTKNIDGFRLSTYYHLDRGGKIQQGPAWDYNLSLANGNYLQGAFPQGWYKDALNDFSPGGGYPYWPRLFEDPNFQQKIADRWTELRQTVFTTENMLADIQAAVDLISNGNPNMTNLAPGEPSNPISRNYDRWTTGSYGEGVYHWPNCFFGTQDNGVCPPSPLPNELSSTGRPNSYDDYIYIMKWFLENRLAWIDTQFAPPLSVAPGSGIVAPGTQVTIGGPTGFDVYYTLDGSDPRKPLIIEEEKVILEAGGVAQATVPTSGAMIDECDDGLRLTTPGNCFVNPAYVLGTKGETWTDVTLPVGFDTEGNYNALLGTNVEASMLGVNSSMYLRVPFTVDAETLANAKRLKLSTRYDDGFVAYIWFSSLRTPVEIARVNAGAASTLPIRALSFDAAATETHPDEVATQFVDLDLSNAVKYLKAGETNYLVIHALNESAANNDFLMDFKLTLGTDRTEVAPSVIRYSGPVNIDRNSRLVARGYNADRNEWTAPATLTYVVHAPKLAITEINYNPHEPTAAELAVNPNWENDDFEYIELQNVGSEAASLLGVQFEGIELTLGDISLAPGELGVVVRNTAAFTQRYGSSVKNLGEFFGGTLNNAGESLRVLDTFGSKIIDLSYDDNSLWPQSADGGGTSIQLVDPATVLAENLSKYYSWDASVEFGGSPGSLGASRPGIVINEILANTDGAAQKDAIELANTTAAPIDIGGWYLSDSLTSFDKFRVPLGVVVPAGGFVVFNEDQFNADPDTGFALSGLNGDDVYLTVADPTGKLTSVVAEAHFLPSLAGEAFGRDASGRLSPVQQVTLGAANSDPRIGPVVVSELNYNPGEPSAAALAIDPTLLRQDLEFVEILNPTNTAISLEDWRVRGGVEYNFRPEAQLGAGEAIVLVPFNPDAVDSATRLNAFRTHYGLDGSVRLFGPLVGSMSNAGERVAVLRPDTSLIGQPIELPRVHEDEVVFDDRLPWPAGADGTGGSLQRRGPALYGNDGLSWRTAEPTPGRAIFEDVPGDFDGDGLTGLTDITLLFNQLQSPTPGGDYDVTGDGLVNTDDRDHLILNVIGTTYGDADLDYVFDSRDLVRLFQIGEYEDAIPGNSTWDEGDWDGDGDFTSADLTLAAQHNGYVAERAAAVGAQPLFAATDAITALSADRALAEFQDDGLDVATNDDPALVSGAQGKAIWVDVAARSAQETRALSLTAAVDADDDAEDELLGLLATDL